MAFRETSGYSRTAVNAGDFFKNHGRQILRDEVTGVERPERTWIVEREIEFEDVGHTVEFGEKTVVQLARLIGYVSKFHHEENKAKLAASREHVKVLDQEILDLEATVSMLIKQLSAGLEVEEEEA